MELLDTVVSASALLTFFFTMGGFCIKVYTRRPAEEVLTEWVHSPQPLAQATPSRASAVAPSPQPPSGEDNTIFPFFHPKKTKEQWLEEGDTAARAGHFDEALGAYTEVIQLDPKDTVAQRRKGYMLNQLKRYDEALVALEEAIRLDPNNAHSYIARGEALKGLNRHPEALAAHNQAVQLEATTPKAQAGKNITEPPSYGPQADVPQSAAPTLPSSDSLRAGVPTPLASPGVKPASISSCTLDTHGAAHPSWHSATPASSCQEGPKVVNTSFGITSLVAWGVSPRCSCAGVWILILLPIHSS